MIDMLSVSSPSQFFNLLLKALEGKFIRSYKFAPEDQICLYYHKLKSNSTNTSLAITFGVDENTVSSIFEHMVEIMFDHSRQYLWWLSKREVQETMPKSFKQKFPNTRVIIDATEIRTQIPKSVRAAILKYSSYKHYHSLKVLIGIAPNGIITFISQAYGGRITDSQLTVHCGILDKLESGDAVMCDKGFPEIEEDLIRRQGFQIMPSFRNKNFHQ